MELFWGVLFLCGGPLFFIFLGAWLAKGMPGSPFVIRSRRAERGGEAYYENSDNG